jgi:LysR family transcriptional regulator (chromosome initiation inhibitor)
MLDYKLIEAFAMVIQEGSFEKAARALYITQSAVSQRVKLLEEFMGQILIARSSPPRPTPAGLKFLKHYHQVRCLEDDLFGDIDMPGNTGFTSIALGVNADSLAFWFLEAIHKFILQEKILLDIRVCDQEQTHQLLKGGEVMGCISTQDQPMQGCRIEYIESMNYHLMATPEFVSQWFPHGLTFDAVSIAPAVIFDRHDDLHHKLLGKALGKIPHTFPIHYVPSVEKFADFIKLGLAYGMLPAQQCIPLTRSGKMIDLMPDCNIQVKLFWHCWNLKSDLLEKLTKEISDNKFLISERVNSILFEPGLH